MYSDEEEDRPKNRKNGEERNQLDIECRICRETDIANDRLLRPCKCKGSMSYIHHGCLKQWIITKWEETNRSRGAPPTCEICQTPFKITYSSPHHGILPFLFSPQSGAYLTHRILKSSISLISVDSSYSAPKIVWRLWQSILYIALFSSFLLCRSSFSFKMSMYLFLVGILTYRRKSFGAIERLLVCMLHAAFLGFGVYVVEYALSDPRPDFGSFTMIILGIPIAWYDTDRVVILGTIVWITLWSSVYNIIHILHLTWVHRCRPISIWSSCSIQLRSWTTLTTCAGMALGMLLSPCYLKPLFLMGNVLLVLGLIAIHRCGRSDPISKGLLAADILYLVIVLSGAVNVFLIDYRQSTSGSPSVSVALPGMLEDIRAGEWRFSYSHQTPLMLHINASNQDYQTTLPAVLANYTDMPPPHPINDSTLAVLWVVTPTDACSDIENHPPSCVHDYQEAVALGHASKHCSLQQVLVVLANQSVNTTWLLQEQSKDIGKPPQSLILSFSNLAHAPNVATIAAGDGWILQRMATMLQTREDTSDSGCTAVIVQAGWTPQHARRAAELEVALTSTREQKLCNSEEMAGKVVQLWRYLTESTADRHDDDHSASRDQETEKDTVRVDREAIERTSMDMMGQAVLRGVLREALKTWRPSIQDHMEDGGTVAYRDCILDCRTPAAVIYDHTGPCSWGKFCRYGNMARCNYLSLVHKRGAVCLAVAMLAVSGVIAMGAAVVGTGMILCNREEGEGEGERTDGAETARREKGRVNDDEEEEGVTREEKMNHSEDEDQEMGSDSTEDEQETEEVNDEHDGDEDDSDRNDDDDDDDQEEDRISEEKGQEEIFSLEMKMNDVDDGEGIEREQTYEGTTITATQSTSDTNHSHNEPEVEDMEAAPEEEEEEDFNFESPPEYYQSSMLLGMFVAYIIYHSVPSNYTTFDRLLTLSPPLSLLIYPTVAEIEEIIGSYNMWKQTGEGLTILNYNDCEACSTLRSPGKFHRQCLLNHNHGSETNV